MDAKSAALSATLLFELLFDSKLWITLRLLFKRR